MSSLFATSPLPCIEYFKLLNNSSAIIIDGNECFKKQSNRNRYHILSANGIQTLTIPLQHADIRKLMINEIKISFKENWQRQHWRSIEAAYNNSAYFIFYRDAFEDIFFRKEDFLFQYNTNLLNWVLKSLKINATIDFNSPPKVNIDTLNDYRILSDLKNTQLKFDSTPIKKYSQVFSAKYDFIPNLSILDLLFNTGPQAKVFL